MRGLKRRLQDWLEITRLAGAWQDEHAILEGRVDGAEARIARDLSLLVKQGPKGTLYVRLPAGAGSIDEPWRLGTVWAHVDVLDWVSDEKLTEGPVTRVSKTALYRLRQFLDAGGRS